MDRRLPRLFVPASLTAGVEIAPSPDQSHYLASVLRLEAGAEVLVFNGRDGEWRARLTAPNRKTRGLLPLEQTRAQTLPGDLHYLFAPLKMARLDYMVQKATEMGASLLAPVLTRRTQVTRVNLDRMIANAVEAAEQCGLLSVPGLADTQTLPAALAHLEPGRLLVFCDEEAPLADPLAALAEAVASPASPAVPAGGETRRLAVLIGPEGGFDETERAMILRRPGVVRLSLGPRILRADTAAVAALTLVQAALGDLARRA